MDRSDQKKLLIAQGSLYRSEVILGRRTVRASMGSTALARGVVQRLAVGGLTAFLGRSGAIAGSLPLFLPLVMRAVSFLAGHKRVRTGVLPVAAMSAAALAAYAYFKRKPG